MRTDQLIKQRTDIGAELKILEADAAYLRSQMPQLSLDARGSNGARERLNMFEEKLADIEAKIQNNKAALSEAELQLTPERIAEYTEELRQKNDALLDANQVALKSAKKIETLVSQLGEHARALHNAMTQIGALSALSPAQRGNLHSMWAPMLQDLLGAELADVLGEYRTLRKRFTPATGEISRDLSGCFAHGVDEHLHELPEPATSPKEAA
ncbi:MAG: hypothetical protein AAFV47_09195 [Pseudomonadota bacterium]